MVRKTVRVATLSTGKKNAKLQTRKVDPTSYQKR